ncbi:TetR/AcrR family transcriptional regulator [Skermania sp. ID1734]|uniref:TetR/AcrR family transcriptional regulator n=1 Tax=Skermania sp. ID1734 TaxID=2597516 RepID=UPI00117C34E0|nr:TetR family transcriptional regulator [Skermania sp. ID1734]TSE01909.1 TetR/AcrR family transcriptional regulator [Skermania sp. ID1734]
MRSTTLGRAADGDLTTRARIRDAAIEVFGERGFATGVRAIATAAGVSPGLVNHHFGSKDGLRAECDAYVLESIRAAKSESLRNPTPAGLLAALADIEGFAPVVAYVVRSLQTGGALAVSLFEQMVANAEQYLAEGVEAGTLRPSRDATARARYLATTGGGGLLLFLQLRADSGGRIDYRKALREYADQMMLPALEIHTEGLLTDSMMLDTLLDKPTPRPGQGD